MLQWFWMQSPLVWAGAVLSGAILLVILGIRGRRVGREPRCRRCGYELTGLQSANCPECGRVDVLKRPRIGVRRRRWGWVCSGAAILMAMACIAGWIWRTPTWRASAPVMLLTGAMDFGDVEAEGELYRRLASGQVQSWELKHLVARAIAGWHSPFADLQRRSRWEGMLYSLNSDGQLTDAQWEAFMEKTLLEFQATPRLRTRVGDRIPVNVQAQFAGQFTTLTGRIRIRPLDTKHASGDWVPWSGMRRTYVSGVAAEMSTTHRLPPGRHAVEFQLEAHQPLQIIRAMGVPRGSAPAFLKPFIRPSKRAEIDRLVSELEADPVNPFDSTEISPVVREFTHVLHRRCRVDIEVFPEDSDQDFERLSGPEYEEGVRRLLRFEPILEHPSDSTTHRFQFRMTEPPPWPLAFDVYLRNCGDRFLWGRMRARAGEPRMWDDLSSTVTSRLRPGPVWVELVPSVDLARGAVDMRFIDQTVTLGPVEYAPRAAATAPASARTGANER